MLKSHTCGQLNIMHLSAYVILVGWSSTGWPAFRSVARSLDYAEYGGAPLLGVKGVVVVAHGRSNTRAIRRALLVARQAAEGGLLVEAISSATAKGGA